MWLVATKDKVLESRTFVKRYFQLFREKGLKYVIPIDLALELGIGTVLIDEADGREQAEKLNLEVRGTLGILERAAKLGMIDFRQALSNLERTNFRISPTIRAAFLQRNP